MKQAHFYATDDELAQLQRAATKQGLTLSAYVRQSLGLPAVRRGRATGAATDNLTAPLPASIVQPRTITRTNLVSDKRIDPPAFNDHLIVNELAYVPD